MSGPICVNHGCNQVCHSRKIGKKGKRDYRSVCYHCHKAASGHHQYKIGVTPYKTGKCSNTDGHLGWKCKAEIQHSCQTELDHIDGDRLNNTLENIQELCRNCHVLKTNMNKDHKNNRLIVRTDSMIKQLGYSSLLKHLS